MWKQSWKQITGVIQYTNHNMLLDDTCCQRRHCNCLDSRHVLMLLAQANLRELSLNIISESEKGGSNLLCSVPYWLQRLQQQLLTFHNCNQTVSRPTTFNFYFIIFFSRAVQISVTLCNEIQFVKVSMKSKLICFCINPKFISPL